MELEENFNIIKDNKLEKNNEQNNFIKSTLGNTINSAIDLGLKIILPDFIENEIIEVKDSILNNGLKEGIKSAINTFCEFGKSISNLITGNYKNVSQINEAIGKDGLINEISKSLKEAVEKIEEKGIIDKKTAKKIKKGEEKIKETISENIEDKFKEQLEKEKKIEKGIEKWEKYYKEENFKGMEREYKKIKKELEEFIPFEETREKAEKIENINNLIKSKNGKFELSDTEKELIKKL